MGEKEVVIWRQNQIRRDSQQRKLLTRNLKAEARVVQGQGLDREELKKVLERALLKISLVYQNLDRRDLDLNQIVEKNLRNRPN